MDRDACSPPRRSQCLFLDSDVLAKLGRARGLEIPDASPGVVVILPGMRTDVHLGAPYAPGTKAALCRGGAIALTRGSGRGVK